MRNLDVWYSRLQVQEGLPATCPTVLDKKSLADAEKMVTKARTKDSMQALRQVDARRGRRAADHQRPAADRSGRGDDVGRGGCQAQQGHPRAPAHLPRSLLGDRRHLLEDFRFVHMAHKVVGVGSVGTRAWIVLMLGRDDARSDSSSRPRRRRPSVLAPFVGKSRLQNQGQRVVEGQRLMQAASDIFLGWERANGLSRRDPRLLHPPAARLEGLVAARGDEPAAMGVYGRICGADAGSRARSIGRPDRDRRLPRGRRPFDRAIAEFAEAYADQNDRDYQALKDAAASGRIEAKSGI